MSHVLMICHDQHLDRRVVVQAVSLIAIGHNVTLLALAFDSRKEETITPEGIRLIRIGLDEIIPANFTYTSYMKWQSRLNVILNTLCNKLEAGRAIWNFLFRRISHINWMTYRVLLLLRYRNINISDPLPFTSAFLKNGANYPADIVVVHDLPGLEAGAQLSEEWRVPLVYDAHELYPEQRSFSTIQRKICSEVEARLIHKAQLVFAVNDSIAELMAKRYTIPKPITLLNAIDPHDSFDPQVRHDRLREKLGLSNDRRILLFQGGFAPNRNLEKLIDSIARVKSLDIDLIMLGFGDYGEMLKVRAKKRGLLGKRIHFLPAVPHSELLQHSASADMGVIPYPHVDLNSYYCSPNKLFEFIQAGVPILANDSPELRRFVGEQGFGLVRPLHTAQQIAAAIDEAFSCVDLDNWKNQLIKQREKFSWSAQNLTYLSSICPLFCTSAPEAQLQNTESV